MGAAKVKRLVPQKKKALPKHPAVSKPTVWTKEMSDEIYKLLADGKSLRDITDCENMPEYSVLAMWISTNSNGMGDLYVAAKSARALEFVDDISRISDTDRYDRKGNDNVARSKLMVETRKFLLSKFQAKMFRDSIDVNHGGEVDAKVGIYQLPDNGRDAK